MHVHMREALMSCGVNYSKATWAIKNETQNCEVNNDIMKDNRYMLFQLDSEGPS